VSSEGSCRRGTEATRSDGTRENEKGGEIDAGLLNAKLRGRRYLGDH
jgi:hypothetical protein